MVIIGLACGLSIASLAMAIVALAVAGWGVAEIRGYKMSTHNIQYVSADESAREKADDAALNKFYDDLQVKALNDKMGETRDEQ
jgi:hypothetical protein